MLISRETLKNCSDKDLNDLWALVSDMSDLPLSYDINKLMSCVNSSKHGCSHLMTHIQFIEFWYKEIRRKIKYYLTWISNMMELFKSNFLLYFIVREMKIRLKNIKLCVKSYKANEWKFDNLRTPVQVQVFEDYLNMVYTAIDGKVLNNGKIQAHPFIIF
ncbi:Uncharacterised protein (plasmid) [Mesomycoplasma conjunctivae]|nr:hypothetical protein [Mycoplasmopsis fermentans]VEU67553.1 Uncharacterised protein [Mesomycoplasma conjunctivae]AAN85229.1 ICEF-IA ORF20 [Mycoplasmopsis fermentans]ADV34374.1 Hypothetical Protein MfeM64YM_0372 [Mycoplasmopsis fermentans M64]VEU60411.1 Uncharacterised protein [Mycoplasmopsis fermentans]VEU64185.1 Uncharacterised protein [Mycoplasmopsis fermentans]